MSQSAIGRLWSRLVGTSESNTEQVGCCGPSAEDDDSKGGGCC